MLISYRSPRSGRRPPGRLLGTLLTVASACLLLTSCEWDFSEPVTDEVDEEETCYSSACQPVQIVAINPMNNDTVAGVVTVQFTAKADSKLTSQPRVYYGSLSDSTWLWREIVPVSRVARRRYEVSWSTADHPEGGGFLRLCAESAEGSHCARIGVTIDNVP